MELPLDGGTICEVYEHGAITGVEIQFDGGSYDDLFAAFRAKLLDLGWSGGDSHEGNERDLVVSTFLRGEEQLELTVIDLSAQFGNDPVLVSLTRSARLD